MQKSIWKGTISNENGVTVIKNPKETMYGADILHLEEGLSIGKAEGKEEFQFTEIRSPRSAVAVDDQGNIYVLDVRDCWVKVFDKDGKFLRTVGKKGQGPGEFEGPYQLILSAQNEIIVEELLTRRLTFFSLNGVYLKRVSLVQAGIADINMDSAENIYGLAVIQEKGNPRY